MSEQYSEKTGIASAENSESLPLCEPVIISVLDLCPVPSGLSPADAVSQTVSMAEMADNLGFYRYWLSEHHNTQWLGSATPEIMTARIAATTKNLRVGCGGIMLPNHAPLKVAETFHLLEALYPGRIDLGLGRAVGTDQLTSLALRRMPRTPEALQMLDQIGDDFAEQVYELMAFLSEDFPDGHPLGAITAIPTGVAAPELWMLGSSEFSARLAARLGIGYAFAHQHNPDNAAEVIGLYRSLFKPWKWSTVPKVILGVYAICADTDAKAEELASSSDLSLLHFQNHGTQARPLPSVFEAQNYIYSEQESQLITANKKRRLAGSPQSLKQKLDQLVSKTGADEVMLTSLIHDEELRHRSFQLIADVYGLTAASAGF